MKHQNHLKLQNSQKVAVIPRSDVADKVTVVEALKHP